MEIQHQESSPERFDFTEIQNKFLANDASLRFVRMNTPVEGEQPAPLHINENGWKSVTSTRTGAPVVVLGRQQLPEEKDRLFQWGADTESAQLLVKAAHESAHVYQIQKGLDKALEDHLNNVPRELTREQVAYIDLYHFFNERGSVTGLSSESIYALQSREANMNVHALEDITELLGAFTLGDEYFLWRLNRLGMFSDEEKEEIMKRIVAFAPA